MTEQPSLEISTGTNAETWWIGHPSVEYLASMNEDAGFRDWIETQCGTEWFCEPLTADSVIQVKGPAHLCERAIAPFGFFGMSRPGTGGSNG